MPIWPVVALLVVAVATPIGLSVIDDFRNGRQAVTSIQETEGYWNSTIGHPALRDRPVSAVGRDATVEYVGISHVAPSLHGSASATIGTGWDSVGGQNEALHRRYSPPQDGVARAPVWGPIMINGKPCMQCK